MQISISADKSAEAFKVKGVFTAIKKQQGGVSRQLPALTETNSVKTTNPNLNK
jgi:hypothetical protein